MSVFRHNVSLVCLGLIVSAGSLAAELTIHVGTASPTPGGRAQMREAPTKEEVLERKAKAPAPFAANTVTAVPDGQAERPVARPSLAGSALLLNDGRQWTMLPPRAVLRFPEEIKSHIRQGKVGNLVSWEQFQNANRAWILSVPMTEAHLTGKQPITEEQKKKWAETRQMLVGTYAGNPVALPLAPSSPVAVEATASNPSTPAKP